jgi:hypothetical protein
VEDCGARALASAFADFHSQLNENSSAASAKELPLREDQTMVKAEVAFILGAGFSTYGGLPLVSNFTEEMLLPDSEGDTSDDLIQFLKQFIHDAFDHWVNNQIMSENS